MKRISSVDELEPGKQYLVFENQVFDLKLTMREDGFMEPKCGKKVIAFNAQMFMDNEEYELFGPTDGIQHDYQQLVKNCE